jgi:hypothetical protein
MKGQGVKPGINNTNGIYRPLRDSITKTQILIQVKCRQDEKEAASRVRLAVLAAPTYKMGPGHFVSISLEFRIYFPLSLRFYSSLQLSPQYSVQAS